MSRRYEIDLFGSPNYRRPTGPALHLATLAHVDKIRGVRCSFLLPWGARGSRIYSLASGPESPLGDLVFAISGEPLLPDASPDEVLKTVQRLRGNEANVSIEHDGNFWRIAGVRSTRTKNPA